MDHAFEEAAAELAKFIASHGMTLIFGGSNVGTMKTVADAALSAGGKVVGVFTTNLPMSLAHPGLTELVVTHSLAERKREMIERADALLALPGGLGTLDELFDALALRRVKNGGHKKPVGVLNVNGYYDPILDFIIQTRNAGFSSGSVAQTLVSGRTPEELFDRLVGSLPPMISDEVKKDDLKTLQYVNIDEFVSELQPEYAAEYAWSPKDVEKARTMGADAFADWLENLNKNEVAND